jgi:hypothetical protein
VTGQRFRTRLAWRTTGGIRVPHIEFPVFLSEGNSGFTSVRFQWDTGATFSVIGKQLALDLGIDLSDDPESEVRGVSGQSKAWFVRRWARFPGIDGYQFKLRLLVPVDPLPDWRLPLFGMLDTYQNFDVRSADEDYFFFLADRHKGEAVPADDDRGS